MSPSDFSLTKHAIERLRERNVEFAKLVDKVCKPSEPALKKRMSYDFFNQSVEEKSFLNDTRFMTSLYERYGYDHRYYIFTRDNMLFVGISNDHGNHIVTTLTRDMHRTSHVRVTKKKWIKKNEISSC